MNGKQVGAVRKDLEKEFGATGSLDAIIARAAELDETEEGVPFYGKMMSIYKVAQFAKVTAQMGATTVRDMMDIMMENAS